MTHRSIWIQQFPWLVVGTNALDGVSTLGRCLKNLAHSGRRAARPVEKPSVLSLGLRELGAWWVELYLIPGEPASCLVQFIGSSRQITVQEARLEFSCGAVVMVKITGARAFAQIPQAASSSGIRLVVEHRDGTVFTASWRRETVRPSLHGA